MCDNHLRSFLVGQNDMWSWVIHVNAQYAKHEDGKIFCHKQTEYAANVPHLVMTEIVNFKTLCR